MIAFCIKSIWIMHIYMLKIYAHMDRDNGQNMTMVQTGKGLMVCSVYTIYIDR